MEATPNTPTDIVKVHGPSESEGHAQSNPLSRKRLALAFAVAAVSDVIALWTELVPPLQWTLDIVTALLLFLILGRQWAILPGLVAEAIPGLAAFPVWILVVLAVVFYPKRIARQRAPVI